MYAEEDSGDSSQQDDDDSDADTEPLVFGVLVLRSRSICSTTGSHGQRSNLAPQSMQWAIRSRESAPRSAGTRVGNATTLHSSSTRSGARVGNTKISKRSLASHPKHIWWRLDRLALVFV
jgi:E3 ubiquitin-protein ligase EDD1